jgi:hypothetical protein
MIKVFARKQFSDYLGENRAILDVYTDVLSGATPSPSSTPTPTATPTQTPTTSPGGLSPTPTTTPTLTPTMTVPVFTTEYQAILNRASALGLNPPCITEQIRQNQLIIDLINGGLWSKLGVLYMFSVDLCGGVSPAFTLINWITPTEVSSTLGVSTGTNYPTLLSYSGWSFDQTNFINVGTNVLFATVNPVNITLSGNSEGTYVTSKTGDSSTSSNQLWSTNNNQWNKAFYNDTNNHTIFRNNGLTSNYDFTGIGYKAASIDGRPDTDTSIVFTNGTTQTTRTKTAKRCRMPEV